MEGREEFCSFSPKLPFSSPTYSPENLSEKLINPIPFFRMSIARIANQATAESRSKALNALIALSDLSEFSFSSLTPDFAMRFAASMIQEGYSQKTTAYYLKQIATLYNEAAASGLVDLPNPFSEARSRLLEFPETSFRIPAKDTVDRLRKFFRDRETIPQSVRRFAADIVAFSILSGGIPLSKLSSLKKGSTLADDETVRQIAERYIQPRNRYIFPLDQSRRTPSQIRKDVAKLFHIALSPYGIPLSPVEDNTPFDLWSLVALRNGVSPALLSPVSGGKMPSFNPLIPLLTPEEVTPTEVEAIRAKVATTLINNPVEWHAMQFRPFVDFEKVKRAMEDCHDEVSFAELFYPEEEISKRVGNKIMKENRPLIPGLLFFRSRATEIAPMFRNIGHLAWCYRQNGTKSGAYAVIPRGEMQRYQTVIGQFTSDMEIYPSGTLPIKEDDRVIMLGGNFMGKEATVSSIKTDKKGRTIARLLFIGGNGLEWTVDTDPRLLQKQN